jgi:hypothetical protein
MKPKRFVFLALAFWCAGIAKAQLPPPQPVRFVTMGDGRQSAGNLRLPVWHDIATLAAAENPQFSIYNGDMAFFGWSKVLWQNFFNQGRPLVQAAPMYPVWGNHEFATRLPYRRFDFPGDTLFSRIQNGFGNYAFNVGPLHVAVVNTDPNFLVAAGLLDASLGEGTRTYRFLEQDLAGNTQPWTIVFVHRPPYSAAEHGPQADVQALTPLFDQYGVDIVFGGHDHGYQRSKPIYGGQVSDEGPIYIVSAGAGARLYDLDIPNNANWLANASASYNYSVVEADQSQLTVTTKNERGEVIDQVTLQQ